MVKQAPDTDKGHDTVRRHYTRSLKYHLVEMLGARIDVVEASISHFNAYLFSLPDKKTTTAVVKCDKTSGLDRQT